MNAGKSSKCYCSALAIWTFFDIVTNYSFLGLTFLAYMRYVALGIAALLICFSIMRQRFSYLQLFGLSVLFLMVVLVSYFSRTEALIVVVLFAITAREVNVRSLGRAVFAATLLAALVVLVACLLGFIPDSLSFRGGVERHALGFKHPNMLGGVLVASAIALFVWKWGERRRRYYLYVVVLAVFLEVVANARSSVVILVLLLAFLVADYLRPGFFAHKGFCWVIVIAAVISVLLAVVYDSGNSVMRTVDLALSERLYYSNVYYRLYGFSLLGQEMNSAAMMIGDVYAGALDNAYVHMAVELGILPLILFVSVMAVSTRRLAVCGESGMVCACVLFALFGLSETYLYVLSFNFTIVACSVAIYGSSALSSKNEG